MAAALQGMPIASTSTATPICQESFAKSLHQMNPTLQSRATYSTASSGQILVSEVGAAEETPNHSTQVAEVAENDANEDADSEAESDTSQCFDSESEEIEPQDGDNDTAMTNMESSLPPVLAQTGTYAAMTNPNPNKKPRRCKLSRKHYNAHGTQRSMTSPVLASGMDIDMVAPAEEDPGDYYTDSSADEDTDRYAYSTWFGGIYHPMWLGHATASGKKRRENNPDDDAGRYWGGGGKAGEVGAPAEVGERHIRLPSLSRRKRAWKASQKTPSSAGESEWSLTLNHPMPPPSGSNAGTMSSSPMTPAPIATTKQMCTAPRSTQPRYNRNLARALSRRLDNLRVEDLSCRSTPGTTVSPPTAAIANDLGPRVPPDQHEKKRTRYQQTTPFEAASVETTGGNVLTPQIFWEVVQEEPMDFKSSGVDGQWGSQGFGMTGIEVSMASPMGGMVPLGVSERAKDISKVMEGVDDLL